MGAILEEVLTKLFKWTDAYYFVKILLTIVIAGVFSNKIKKRP
jgi:hypothetical protein